jgi:hypothetical protein
MAVMKKSLRKAAEEVLESQFIMSVRFSRETPEDFGLVRGENPDVFIRQSDNSLWKSRRLYDFGWGDEYGFYKIPLPGFKELVEIGLRAEHEHDKYGAAAVIFEDYCDELLGLCLEVIADDDMLKEYLEFFTKFRFHKPYFNEIIGQRYSEDSEDYAKWLVIAQAVKDAEILYQSTRKRSFFEWLFRNNEAYKNAMER